MEYDPLISKLVTWGENRTQAIQRMLRALEEYHLIGIRTNIIYLRKILMNKDFVNGNYNTHFIGRYQDDLLKKDSDEQDIVALAAAAILAWQRDKNINRVSGKTPQMISPWKLAGRPWRFVK
jgi:acetyl/propionyl-CoA carboxylase alpha subunit